MPESSPGPESPLTSPTPAATLPRGQLDIDDYLSASSDASSRTRTILLVMVVASVLALTGLFNSLQSQWMHGRMLKLSDPNGPYMESKIGKAPSDQSSRAYKLYEKRQEALCAAVESAYVEGSLVIKVPFFGITVDVNDLGVIGGVGFLIILSCYRFFLSREIDNLRISFTVARAGGDDELSSFYRLLAMRQVFTIPESGFINRTPFLRYLPKFITWIPVCLLVAIAAHDLDTSWIGFDLEHRRFLYEFACQVLCIALASLLAWSITVRFFWMDDIWNATAFYINTGKLSVEEAEKRWNLAFRLVG